MKTLKLCARSPNSSTFSSRGSSMGSFWFFSVQYLTSRYHPKKPIKWHGLATFQWRNAQKNQWKASNFSNPVSLENSQFDKKRKKMLIKPEILPSLSWCNIYMGEKWMTSIFPGIQILIEKIRVSIWRRPGFELHYICESISRIYGLGFPGPLMGNWAIIGFPGLQSQDEWSKLKHKDNPYIITKEKGQVCRGDSIEYVWILASKDKLYFGNASAFLILFLYICLRDVWLKVKKTSLISSKIDVTI
jgi:hypothetical protein